MTNNEVRSVEVAAQEHLDRANTHYLAMVREKHRAIKLWVDAAKRSEDRATRFRFWSAAAETSAQLINKKNDDLTSEYIERAIECAPNSAAIIRLRSLVKR